MPTLRFFPYVTGCRSIRLAGLGLGLALISSAQAATITVTSASDAVAPAGACSLRGAVNAISTAGGVLNSCTNTGGAFGTDDTIVFAPALAGSTITFGSQIDIRKSLVIDGTINGANAVTLDGANATRLFYVSGGNAFTLDHLTLQNGKVVGIGNSGGAIAVTALLGSHTLTVRNSAFKKNGAQFSGGAIFTNAVAVASASTFTLNTASTSGGAILAKTATISDSTFLLNTTGSLGGAVVAANAEISGTTFSGNKAADGMGGAINVDNASISNSTFSNNSAQVAGAIMANKNLTATYLTMVNNYTPGSGSALFFAGDRVSIKNSLFVGSNNITTAHCAIQARDPSLSVSGTNIEWRSGSNENSCNSASPVLVPAGVTEEQIVSAALADNGGPTQTLALPAGSPAIDAGDPAVVGTTDQRGQARPQGNGPDLGAYEVAVQAPTHYTHVDITTRDDNGVTLTTINGELVSAPEHVGENTAVFVFTNMPGTNDWWLLNPVTGWHLWVDCNSTAFPYASGPMPWVTEIALFYDADLSAFQGWPILFGYGVGDDATTACTDMFNNARYTQVAAL